MDDKENKIANGLGTAGVAQAQRQDCAQAADRAGAPPIGVCGGVPADTDGSQKQFAPAKSQVDYTAEIAKRDSDIAARDGRIAELEGRAAEADELRDENARLKTAIEQLKNQAASERIDFSLQLAGCRNVKAARAVLDDYDGDVEGLKAAEPWLFSAHETPSGSTGLPNAGMAGDAGKYERRWRKLAGLSPRKPE